MPEWNIKVMGKIFAVEKLNRISLGRSKIDLYDPIEHYVVIVQLDISENHRNHAID